MGPPSPSPDKSEMGMGMGMGRGMGMGTWGWGRPGAPQVACASGTQALQMPRPRGPGARAVCKLERAAASGGGQRAGAPCRRALRGVGAPAMMAH
jgi:hypothetical protein